MITPKEHQTVVDAWCQHITPIVKDLASTETPDFDFGKDEAARTQLLSALNDLAAQCDNAINELAIIKCCANDEELYGNPRYEYIYASIDINLADAICKLWERKLEFERAADEIAEIELDPSGDWCRNAQETLKWISPPGYSIWHKRDLAAPPWWWFVIKALYEILYNVPGASKVRLLNSSLKKHQRIVKKTLGDIFGWLLIGLPIVLFPYYPAYSFGVVVIGLAVSCHLDGCWDEFFLSVCFWGGLFVGIVAWLG